MPCDGTGDPMLELALKARLPLVTCSTTDPLSTSRVLRHLTGRKDVTPLKSANMGGGMKLHAKGQVLYVIGKLLLPGTVEKAEATLKANESSLVWVNPDVKGDGVPPNFYDAGEMPTPLVLVERFVGNTLGPEAVKTLVPLMGGLTLKEVNWLLRLATAEHGVATPEAVNQARKTAFPASRGLDQVDTTLGPYVPDALVSRWAEAELPFFHDAPDDRLRPRGLMLAGPPGTGKTMAAKWLACKLGVPLYRMETSSLFDKYVGETEKVIAQALARADREAPCVFLIDEVEKLFGSHGVSGRDSITDNVLAALLWWLQEHQTHVLTVMTTNGLPKLPPELYRAGRVDATMSLLGVTRPEARALGVTIAQSYQTPVSSLKIKRAVDDLFDAGDDDVRVPQAEVAEAVARAVKRALLKGAKKEKA